MTAGTKFRVIVTPQATAQVPDLVWRRAEAGGWPTCDVCKLPVDPAGVVPEQPERHLGCICEACDAPLQPDDVRWHQQCQPTNPVRHLRIVGRRS